MLNINFGRYSNLHALSAPKAITIENYLNLVKSNPIPIPKKGSKEYDSIKKSLPVITVNANFTKNPSYKTFINPTGFLYIEIDSLTPDTIESVKEYWFNKYNWIVAAYKSLSNTGIHIIIKIDDQLSESINRSKEVVFKSILTTINDTYFNNELDTQAFKLTQYTVIGSDLEPLFRNDYSELCLNNINQLNSHCLDTAKPALIRKDILKATLAVSENLMMEQYDRLKDFEKFRLITGYYPNIKDRYYWFTANDGRIEPELAELFNIYDEIQSIPENEFNLYTRISEHWFGNNCSWTVAEFEEPIYSTTIVTFIKSGEGRRRNRILIESSKLLYNNPFISFDTFLDTLLLFNNIILTKPLLHYEIQDIANYQYQLFITGKMVWNDLTPKYAFYSKYTVIEADEKRKLTSKATYNAKRIENIKKIDKAVKSLHSNGIKVTQKNLSLESGISLRTIERIINQIKNTAKPALIERYILKATLAGFDVINRKAKQVSEKIVF